MQHRFPIASQPMSWTDGGIWMIDETRCRKRGFLVGRRRRGKETDR